MILHTEQLDQLFTALSKAQAEFPLIEKSRTAHYGNYADLSDMLNPLWPVLKAHGLSVYDFTTINTNGSLIINVRLGHSSGQFTTTQCLFREGLAKDAEWGGCLTFIRRYMYRSILGIAIPNDIDDNDDGHAVSSQPLTKEQLEFLEKLPQDAQQKVMSFYKVNNLKDITKVQFDKIASYYNKKS